MSLTIERGQAYGLVGESGCGKTSVAMAIMAYLGRNGRVASGQVLFDGQDLATQSAEDLRALRGRRIAMVYQDPLASLNPCLTVGEQLSEVLTVHQGLGARASRTACHAMLERVRMPDPPAIMRRYPHQISGGQQQRVVIAMALLANPDLLVMDEPTTGLDVTVEATVLDLVAELRRELDTAILYISHNLGVVARICDRVGVMYAGELMEEADVTTLFLAPRHPYTRSLLRCVPRADASRAAQQLAAIPGHVPSPTARPPGCVFEPRCSFAAHECRAAPPAAEAVAPGHVVRCVRWQEIGLGRAGGRERPAADRRRGGPRAPPAPRQRPRLLPSRREAADAAARPAPARAGRGRRQPGSGRRPDAERGRGKRMREEHARALHRRAGRADRRPVELPGARHQPRRRAARPHGAARDPDGLPEPGLDPESHPSRGPGDRPEPPAARQGTPRRGPGRDAAAPPRGPAGRGPGRPAPAPAERRSEAAGGDRARAGRPVAARHL